MVVSESDSASAADFSASSSFFLALAKGDVRAFCPGNNRFVGRLRFNLVVGRVKAGLATGFSSAGSDTSSFSSFNVSEAAVVEDTPGLPPRPRTLNCGRALRSLDVVDSELDPSVVVTG